MAPRDPPFRAEHIGSFLRPKALLDARDAREKGRLDDAGLRAAEDAAIREVVALQESLGLKVATDGEYRRGTYTEDFTTRGLSGVIAANVGTDAWLYTDRSGHREPGRIPTVHDRIRWQDSRNAANFAFLRSIAKATPKLTLPGPCYLHFRAGRQHISRTAYPDLDQFWADIVQAYRTELAHLAEAGLTYLQLDETSLAKLGDPRIRAALDARGDPWQRLLDQYIEATNAVVTAAPQGLRIGMHLCRGNNAGHWQAEGGYDAVAEQVFRRIAVDFFFLEYDSPRAGTFAPLRFVPEHKTIVLGLVSTNTGELEAAELLTQRIREAAQHIDLERLAISPQCGFASSLRGNPLSVEQQVAKVKRTVEVAREMWPDA